MTYRPELDGIRAVAVLLVVAAHLEWPGFGLGGYVGVTLFFVLSGYLITSLLVAERERTGRVDVRAFYLRRARRLLPALGLVMLVVAGWSAWQGRWPWELLPVGLYVGNWLRADGSDLGLLPHAWSLSVEEQFYLLWPAVLLVVGRWLPLVAVAGIVGGVVARAVIAWPGLEYSTLTRGDAILYGALLALVGFRWPRLWPVGLAVVALITVAPVEVLVDPWPVFVAGASVLLIAGAPRFLAWGPLVWLGQRSYGIYLWHMLPVLVVRPLLPDAGLSAVVLAFTLAAAWASYRWVEQPVRLRAEELRPKGRLRLSRAGVADVQRAA